MLTPLTLYVVSQQLYELLDPHLVVLRVLSSYKDISILLEELFNIEPIYYKT